MTSVELRGEEITDVPKRSSQLNTQLKYLRKESLEKKKKQACRDSNPGPAFPPPGSAFARLNLLLFEPHEKKNTASYAG